MLHPFFKDSVDDVGVKDFYSFDYAKDFIRSQQ